MFPGKYAGYYFIVNKGSFAYGTTGVLMGIRSTA
ncbi:hypothetical protein BN1048_01712 [Jeotgalicoccus saudimassiliensis]|uniref:Uncharacterized protein n=1 Tax=Jeotgalicoccus saudimassiliensis TaxID=1461582 RepID=A0A078M4K4_9STAP|nr:hypothetical protein BN1048_01712 [Jeotgalicoccus saudimassiliensis]